MNADEFKVEQAPRSTETRELPEIMPLLRGWWWLLVLSVLVAGASSYVITKRIKPTYEASAKILVDTNSVSSTIGVSNQPTFALQFAATIAQQVTTYSVVEEALIRAGDTSLSESALLAGLQASADPVTPIVTISVRDTRPVIAANLANAVAAAIIDVNQSEQSARYSSLLSTIRSESDAATKEITAVNDQLSNLSRHGSNAAQISALTSQANTLQTYLSSLNTQLNTILLSQAQSNTTLTIIEQAQVPTSPVSPNIRVNLAVALVLGLLLASAVIGVIGFLDDSLRSPQIVERRLNLPVLATISRFTEKNSTGIVATKVRDRNAEAFKTLRTNLQFVNVDRPLRRLLITSSQAQEGKSTISANYAVAAAQTGRRVVLVDCDLRRPSIAAIFDCGAGSGLTDYLLGDAGLRDVVRDSGYENLRVVTSGRVPPNPSELLSSQRMNEFLDRVAEETDLLILDTPPALAVTDASALAPRVDGVVLVLDGGLSTMRGAVRTVQALQLVDAHIVGIVINRYDALAAGYGGYYYYYYHTGTYHSEGTGNAAGPGSHGDEAPALRAAAPEGVSGGRTI